MYTPDVYLEGLYKTMDRKCGFKAQDQSQWKEWRNDLIKNLQHLLGDFPEGGVEPYPKVLEKVDCGHYIRERIEYHTFKDLFVPAYLLTPKGGTIKKPAVVACPGHGYGSKEIIGLLPDGTPNLGDGGVHKNFALELVKRDLIVLIPEVLGFGERRMIRDQEKGPKENSCYPLATYLLMLGQTLIGHRVYETRRAIDYLMTRKDVLGNRIGCMGLSGGGFLTALTSALDERIKATVISGYVNTFKESILAMHHCIDNYIPGILKYGEMADIIGLIAPRPLFVEAGKEDPIFPLTGTKQAISKLESIYSLLKVEANFQKDIFEGGHEIGGSKSFDWLVNNLSNVDLC
jgi:dienelactone hydrolase